MRNAGLDEAQAGIKIAGRNTNNLRYADDAVYGVAQSRTRLKQLSSGSSSSSSIGYPLQYSWASLVAQMVKNLPAMRETWVQFLVRKIPWRRARQPTPVFCPGESHGQRRLVGYSLCGHEEWDRTVPILVEIHLLLEAFPFPLSHLPPALGLTMTKRDNPTPAEVNFEIN